MLIYFIRHGQTDWNVQRIYQGQLDVPLNEQGLWQIEQVGLRFEGVGIERIYHSPLARAARTAQALHAHTGAPLTPVEELKEICMGEWQGRSFADVRREDPERARLFSERPDCPAPGGESYPELQRRALRALEVPLASGLETVAVVSHGALLKTLICHFLCMDLAAIHTFDIANASVSAALYEGGRFKVITLNDMSHLPKAFAHLSQNSAVI